MLSWQSAAAVAVCWVFAISSVSCLATCCEVWPGGKISDSGTTAWSGVSQARSAAKMLNRFPGRR